jgi:predicted ABC-class ATPase
LKVVTEELDELTAEGDSFIVHENETGKDTEKIRARKPRSFKIRARRDSQRLDVDTRLTPQPKGKGGVTTQRKHDAPIV